MNNSDISMFKKLNTLKSVFQFNKTVLLPVHSKKTYNNKNLQPQRVLLLYDHHYCLIIKLHHLINKDSHMEKVSRRCLTAFSSINILYQHMERCIKQ